MTVAYAVASLVLCSTIAFSYFILRNVLEQQSHLTELTAHTAKLQLIVRNSAFHVTELKKVKKEFAPGSRLESKIKSRLDSTHGNILVTQDSIVRKLEYFKKGELHEDIFNLFEKPPHSLLDQLDNYADRLAELVSNKDNQTPGIDLLWLPVEATAAIDGRLIKSIGRALSRLQGIVTDRSAQLSITHTRLSWFAVFVVMLELVLIFIPLSALLKKANSRLLGVHDELYRQANFDSDTGLLNQSGMVESLYAQNKSSNSYGLLIIRIQETDKIHNIAGPAAIGQVFKQLAQRLESMFGYKDNVFRTGDAEFAALISDTSIVSTPVHIGNIQTKLTNPMDVGNVQIYPHVLLGYDAPQGNSPDVADRLVNARLAAVLYEKSKPAIPRYDESLRARIDDENHLAEKIRNALTNLEFTPYYQIKVDADTGEPSGMEALCRWKQPDGSMIAPFHFIPVAEHSGLIAELTWQMLEQIIIDWERWNSMGLDPGRIAFNAAQGFLMEDDCCSRFAQMTATLNCDSCPIDLEITENVALSNNSEHVFSTLETFRRMNVPIALDDFGTGYASLNSIVSMDIDIIKVDQSFVRRMTECKDSHNIVITILNLCKLLEKKSVVEGVETEEQWHVCRSLGCDEIQGYYFHKPAVFDEVTQVLLQSTNMRKAG